MIVQKFQNKVLVIKLLQLGKLQVELCIFKPNIEIEWHHHKLANIEVMHLWGDASYKIKPKVDETLVKTKEAGLFDMFKCYTVKASKSHAAKIYGLGLITLSIQRWTVNPTTVTTDYYKD